MLPDRNLKTRKRSQFFPGAPSPEHSLNFRLLLWALPVGDPRVWELTVFFFNSFSLLHAMVLKCATNTVIQSSGSRDHIPLYIQIKDATGDICCSDGL